MDYAKEESEARHLGEDLSNLNILESFIVPLPTMLPSERKRREQMYGEAGTLTREVLLRVLMGEFY